MSVTFFISHFNIVYADISTGEISIKKAFTENEALDIIESILPSEIVLPKTQEYNFILKTNKNLTYCKKNILYSFFIVKYKTLSLWTYS